MIKVKMFNKSQRIIHVFVCLFVSLSALSILLKGASDSGIAQIHKWRFLLIKFYLFLNFNWIIPHLSYFQQM